jgi:hypothetical protein
MTTSSDNTLKKQTQSKIQFLEDQLVALDHYLPETYEYLMAELDQQRRQLAELEVQKTFQQIESENQCQTPSRPQPTPFRGHREPKKKNPEPNL